MPVGVTFTKSLQKNKKLKATFVGSKGDAYVVNFGDSRYDDYTTHKDPTRRENYIERHGGILGKSGVFSTVTESRKEDWTTPFTAASLSRWVLWGPSTSLEKNIRDFKRRFNLK